MNTHKRFRQGQILNLLAQMKVANQDALRRQLVHRGVRVTQATLSRDLRELKLVKTVEGYRSLTATPEDATPSCPAPAGAGGGRISSRYPPGAKHACTENSAERGATSGRGA